METYRVEFSGLGKGSGPAILYVPAREEATAYGWGLERQRVEFHSVQDRKSVEVRAPH